MSEKPFMQLYVSDFLGDTLHLNTEQIGAYMLLLMAMWNAVGTLPDDDAKLARIARMTVKKWRSVSIDLMAFFDREDGVITHPKIDRRGYAIPGRVSLSSAAKSAIYRRDGLICAYCGDDTGPFHIDHVLAVARGGTNDPENLAVACVACNLSKGVLLPSEWSARQ